MAGYFQKEAWLHQITSVCLLQACACACASAGSSALVNGKQLNAEIREQGLHLLVANSSVNKSAKCGSREDALGMFDRLPCKDVETWNAMIAGYSQQGMELGALLLITSMQQGGLAAPNTMTFVALLQACASVGPAALGRGHAQIREQGLQAHVYHVYAKDWQFGRWKMLKECSISFLECHDSGTFPTRHGTGRRFGLYRAMQEIHLICTKCLDVCVPPSRFAQSVAVLHIGRQLHAQSKEQGLEADALAARSLINMYGKCGSM